MIVPSRLPRWQCDKAEMAEAVRRLPPLPSSCNSWIATSPDGTRFRESWSALDAAALALAGWTVRTALDHLSRLNLPATNTGD